MPIPRFTQAAIDAINWLVANLDALTAQLGKSNPGGGRTVQDLNAQVASRGLATPQVSGAQPLAQIVTPLSGVIGYYNIDVFRRDALIADIATRMTAAKLGSANRSRFAKGYGYTWDETTATEHLLSGGQIFRCEQVATASDGKPIYELFGNPIGIDCDEP